MLTVVVTMEIYKYYSHFSKTMVHFHKRLPVINATFFILTVYDYINITELKHDQYELLTFNLNKCNCTNYVGNNFNLFIVKKLRSDVQ